jgi:sialidase-1
VLTRRSFIPAATLGVHHLVSAAPPRAKIESIAVISQQPEFYHGWPTLARRKSGELLVVYSGGRERHVCPFGRLEITRSHDDGRTWSWPQILMDSVIDVRDAGVLETPGGSILVTTFTSLAYQKSLAEIDTWPPDRAARWRAVERRATQEQRRALLGCWMLRSTDEGMTWSAPYRVPLDSPHGPVALSDGRLVYAGKRLWQPGEKVGVCESRDDGQTWQWLSDIAVRAGDRMDGYHELHIVQTSGDRLVAQIRNESIPQQTGTIQCESSDGGKQWTVPHSIDVPGYPSHLLRLRDSRLLMTYGYRHKPFGNQARISADEGHTWSEPLEISADGAGGDLGYPSTVELPDGALITAWYERLAESPRAVLRMARWSLGA